MKGYNTVHRFQKQKVLDMGASTQLKSDINMPCWQASD